MKPTVGQVPNLSENKRQVGNLSYKSGFTLLEVMLALAILVGALAVLGEFGRLGLRNAKTTRDLTRAEMLCESIMSEVSAGILSTDSVQNSPVLDPVQGTAVSDSQTDDVAPWVYSIDSQTIDEDGLLSVTVTVSQDLPSTQLPVSFSLVHWMLDPSLESQGTSTQTDSSNTQNSGTETSTSSSTKAGT
jgi:general secretion pathway protein I